MSRPPLGGTAPEVRAVALEGLPGAGKTTLLAALRRRLPYVVAVPELVLPAPDPVTEEFCVRNDRAKAARMLAAPCSLVDRYWPSTVAYVLAECRLAGRAASVPAAVAALFGRPPPNPSGYVFLDPARALERSYATDGWFADRAFRERLREAYFEVFAWAGVPALVVGDGPKPALPGFLAEHLRPAGRVLASRRR